jgi:uncharacterized Zn-binding protein involved in type VI secretion
MPGISRNKDRCRTGHRCTGSAPVLASQFNVFANGKPMLKKGDQVQRHTILVPGVPPKCLMHGASVRGSSRKVFVKGVGVARRGDKADKGAMTGASRNVFAG